MKELKYSYNLLIFVLIILGIWNILGCTMKQQEPLFINYFYTDEFTHQKISIEQSKLIYTYFKDTEGKCASWIAQYPCWEDKDLKTKETMLSKKEINELINLIEQTDFMNFEDTYGGTGYYRSYPYELSIKIGEKKKKVIYQSSHDSPPMPEAFEKLKDKLFTLIDKYFENL